MKSKVFSRLTVKRYGGQRKSLSFYARKPVCGNISTATSRGYRLIVHTGANDRVSLYKDLTWRIFQWFYSKSIPSRGKLLAANLFEITIFVIVEIYFGMYIPKYKIALDNDGVFMIFYNYSNGYAMLGGLENE